VSVFDTSQVHFSTKRFSEYFYYEIVDADHHYVRGVGPDQTPFTDDDIVPTVAVTGQMGLTDRSRKARP
jgi:hypothetical protein